MGGRLGPDMGWLPPEKARELLDAHEALREAAADVAATHHGQWRTRITSGGNEHIPKSKLERLRALLAAEETGWAQGIAATHLYYAPGVWLPKTTTRACEESVGPQMCCCAEGHDGPHRGPTGETLPRYGFGTWRAPDGAAEETG